VKGSQNLGYDNPEIARHRKVQDHVSSNTYKEDYEAEKDMVYYPADWNPGYQQQQAVKQSEAQYKKKYEKTKADNKFNACDTSAYKDQKQKKASELDYNKEWEGSKHKVNSGAETMEMLHAKTVQTNQSQRLYKEKGTEFMRNYDLNKGLLNRGDIAHNVTSQKQSDVLNKDYKKDYETGKTKYEFEKVMHESTEIRHNIDTSKNIIDATNANYNKAAKQNNASNEFTKSFCDTEQYQTSKKITEITRDSLYQKGKQEMIHTHQGYQSLNIREIPSFQQHEANQKQISKVSYEEDWNDEKDAIYFPAHVTNSYEQMQRAQASVSDAKYRKDADQKMQQNTFNVADSQHYQDSKSLSEKTSDKNYKNEWENEKGSYTTIAMTREMEQAKEMSNLRDIKYKEGYEKSKMQNVVDLNAPEFQMAKRNQTNLSDRKLNLERLHVRILIVV